MLAIPLGISSAEWYSLPHQNSYHFNTCFGDMCVDTVMHHHSIEVSFGLLESAGVPFYRDVGLLFGYTRCSQGFLRNGITSEVIGKSHCAAFKMKHGEW
jgi:hypothetical protein